LNGQVSLAADGRLVVSLGRVAAVSCHPERISEKLYKRQREGARVPGLDDIRSDLARIATPLPAQVLWGTKGRTDRLRLYINGRYVLMLEVAKNERSYFLTDVSPLGLRDQDQIVRCEFALTARSWELYDHPGDVPDDLNAQWATIAQAWKARPNHGAASAKTSELPQQHREYLDRLDLIIEKGREVELTSKPADRMCRYQRITPAAVQRRTAQSIYKFQVMGESRLVTGAKVHIDEHPGLRGEVKVIRGGLITVKFDQSIDFNQIPALGAFVASPNTTSFEKQAKAVEILREQRSRNPKLLEALVDRRFQPFQPVIAKPAEELDLSQEAAFCMALAVPDLALVQGPPGTGKTRTIKQVVRAIAASGSGRTVLVSSYTNQAVDNVLKDLGKDGLTAVRVGSGVTPGCEHLTLEARATDLQRRILDRTEPHLARYAPADPDGGAVTQRMEALEAERAQLTDAVTREGNAQADLERHDAQLTAPLRSRLAELDTALRAQQAVAARRADQADMAAARQEKAARRATTPVVGFLFAGGERRRTAQAHEAASVAAHAASEAAVTQDLRARAESDLTELRAGDPVLADLRRRQAQCNRDRALCADRAAVVALRLAHSLGPAALPPVSTDPAALARFSAAAGPAVALTQRRLLLLRKWRATLERRTEQLYPELIRYADVVGATCIGVASDKYVSSIDFSVAIIDEAGQITAPNLLVPLVRAERAVLVGDHVQLPPYAEKALVTWARAEDSVLADLVTKSAFELTFPSVPESNRKMLNTQRRMPLVIGAFISNQFYGGQLRTDTNRYERDELFASPLAFVDTAALPAAERRERHPRRGEPWPPRSWVNDLEAELIAALAAYYDARGSDWVVIVPFSAQEGRVGGLLGKLLGDEERAASRVSSVDSFQGGEHDTVIFGFTRSNSKGEIGFFRDVRRSNVAFSRARHRMILVGDLSTLAKASDAGFRSMMLALQDHLRHRGDPRGFREVLKMLSGEAGE
jgi:hypothetical protein